jgi:hypothetical protein
MVVSPLLYALGAGLAESQRRAEEKRKAESEQLFKLLSAGYVPAEPIATAPPPQTDMQRDIPLPPMPQAAVKVPKEISGTGAIKRIEKPRTGMEISESAANLRKEFSGLPVTKQTAEINSQLQRANAVWDQYQRNPGAQESKNALDQVLVIALNKALDPGSVVRESEFARTPQGISLFNRFNAGLSKLSEGGVGLTDADRADLINALRIMAGAQNEYYGQFESFFRREAETQGIEPERVVLQFGRSDTNLVPTRKQPIKAAVKKESIEVISPDGVPGTIPSNQLQEAIKQGFKVVE